LQLGKHRPEVLDVIVWYGDNNKTHRESGKIPLVLDVLVDGNEDIEALLGQDHRLPVGDTTPAHFVGGPYLVLGKRAFDPRIDAFV
jgi:hypothetical protein